MHPVALGWQERFGQRQTGGSLVVRLKYGVVNKGFVGLFPQAMDSFMGTFLVSHIRVFVNVCCSKTGEGMIRHQAQAPQYFRTNPDMDHVSAMRYSMCLSRIS